MKYIDIVGKRKIFFTLSLAIIITGIVFGFVRGINFDIDFTGGTIININLKMNEFKLDDIKKIVVDKTGVQNTTVLPMGINKDQVSIRTSKALSTSEIKAIFDTLKPQFGLADSDMTGVDTIEPLIGKELRNSGLRAVAISSTLTLLYLSFVFRKMGGFTAGITGVIGILHDLLILFSVYLIAYIPINNSFIAAALTLLGYSINDTIIVYDRVRENEKSSKKQSVAEMVNNSIIQTLPRTINTSIGVIITISILYGFGIVYNIDVLKEFTLPLLVGIISGTYSSMCICSPLYVMWHEFSEKREKLKRA